MQISEQGIKFIQSYEGCRLSVYLDQGGTPTIGYGFTHYPDGIQVKMTDKPLTQEQADSMFLLIVQPYSTGVIEACIGSVQSLTQQQIDSLTSFAYNCGLGAFRQSVLLQHVLLNKVTEEDFTMYDHVGQKVSVGLLARRKAEYQLFITSSGVQIVPPIKTMEITSETPSVIKINSITVNVDILQNGETVQSGANETVEVTPELITAFQNSNLVAPEATNVTVVA